MNSLEKIHQKVKNALKEADAMFKSAFVGKTEVYQQQGIQLSTSVVTKTDKDIDKLLRARLEEAFPDIGFVTEEKEERISRKEYNWIIDPIDGTANFAHKIPICGISIALWKEDEPLYGAVSFPMLAEKVHAIKGKGIYFNGKKIKKSKSYLTERKYITSNHVGTNAEKMKVLEQITKVVSYPADYHCASYQGVLVSLRKVDCWVVVGLPIWDIAAVLLFAAEAGLHTEFVSKPPSIKREDVREYRNTFVIAEKRLAIKLAHKIKSALVSTR